MSSYYQPDWTNGTIDLTSGSTAFTIAGVDLVAIGVQPGDSIYHTTTGRELIIDGVTDSTHGVLAYNCPADLAGTGLPLRIRFQPDGSRFAAAYLNVLQKFKGGNLDAFAGLTGAAGLIPVYTGAGTMKTEPLYVAPHLVGLTLSNNTTETTSTFNVSPGSATDIDGSGVLRLTNTFTKNYSLAWAEGSGFVGAAAYGALDTGTWANNTTYHVFLIGKSDGTVDVLCSTSPTNPVMPTGYTLKRRIGALLTDGSGSIRPFLQSGGWFYHLVPVIVLDNGTPASNVHTPFVVPSGIKVIIDFSFAAQSSTGGTASFLEICDPDQGNADIYSNVGAFYTDFVDGQCQVMSNTSSELSVGVSNGGLVSLYCRGWYDGRDTYV